MFNSQKLIKFSPLLGFLLGLLITLTGIFSANLLGHKIWHEPGVYALLSFCLIYFLVGFWLFSTVARQWLVSILSGVVAVFIFSITGIQSLLIPGLFLFSAYLLGDKIIVKLTGKATQGKVDIVLNLILGIAIYLLLLSVLGHVRVNYVSVDWVLLAVPYLINAEKAKNSFTQCLLAFKPVAWNKGMYWSILLFAFVNVLFIVEVVKPDTSADGLSYHLTVATTLFYHHFWHFDFKNYIYALMPLGTEWLYAFVYMLAGEFATHFLNYSFAILTAALLYCYLAEQKKLSLPICLLFVTLYLSAPLVYLEAASLFIDSCWVLFLFSAFVAMLKFRASQEEKYLYLIAVFFGTAMAIKMITILFIFAMAPFIIYEVSFKGTLPAKEKSLFVAKLFGVFLFFSAFIYIYSYIKTGNPIFPYENSFFKSPYYEITKSFNNPLFNTPFNFSSFYDMSFHSHIYLESDDGSFGLQYIFFLPLILLAVILFPSYIFLFGLFVTFFFTITLFHFQSYLRYVYPICPILTLLSAEALFNIKNINAFAYKSFLYAVGILVFLNCYLMPTSGWGHRDFYVPNSRYLNWGSPIRELINYVNVKEPGANILMLDDTVMATASGQVYTNTWMSNQFLKQLREQQTLDELQDFLKQYKIKYIIFYLDSTKKYTYNFTPLLKQFLQTRTTVEMERRDHYLVRIDAFNSTPTSVPWDKKN
ncbi:MAG: glycosyl transferase, family 2 [Gammaproteobacteria bacterium]|jgi:hypothetical protein|nr:glycosyl transferase, family 2 [Gammaproteobacteria bacterium]